jgi:xylulokinase
VGVIASREAVTSWGTSGTVLAPTDKPRVDPKLRAHTFCHVVPNTWYIMGVVLSAGGAFAWFRDQLARDLVGTGEANERLNAEASTIAPGAEGVTFLPYLQGERTPHRDASARGAFIGLSLAHSRSHLARAVVEGVCFALRDSVSILGELGMSPDHMLLTGGGAKSPFVRHLQAEIFGLPVCTVNREEGPAYGAALLAAVGAGAFANLGDAVRATLTRAALVHPEPGAHAAYDVPYARFREAYVRGHPHRRAPRDDNPSR